MTNENSNQNSTGRGRMSGLEPVDDAEGHGARWGGLDDGSQDDDTEGHGARWGGLDDGSHDDDTEDHGFRGP